MAGITCGACGTKNAEGQRFCGNCGASLGVTCPACGADNPAGFRFCGTCGTPLASASAADVLPAEERRWATVLFADISGFTSMSESMDPEDVKALADRCAGRMGEVVREFGGTVVSVMGDAIMAVFGAPVAHEDDPERAVRAGLRLLDALRDQAPEVEGLQVHVGINTGDVMAGLVGPDERRDYTVMGDTTNTAARLMSAAAPGTVLVGEETRRATERSVTYQPVPPVEAKGKQAPVRAWRAVEVAAAPAERPVSTAALIGRERELSLLQEVWQHAQDGRMPQLVTVVGPPGVGKSRLTAEFAGMAVKSGARVLRGRSLPYGESTGYGAFAEQVRAAAGILSSDGIETVRSKLSRHLHTLVGGDAEIEATLGAVLGVSEGGAAADKQILFAFLRRYVEALARRRPTLLVFEDIHWADGTLLDLIESIAGRSRDAPCMLLCLARPELFDSRASWGGGQQAGATVTLSALSEEDSRKLALALLAGRAGAGDLTHRLAEVGGGNPLFIEELAASITEHAADLTESLPNNVKAIIATRLDALSPDARRVLQDAAVVGKVFWRGALEGLAEGNGAVVDAALDDLEGRDFVRRQDDSRIAGDREYLFKHILTQEVAYATVPRARRRDRHAAVARFLEAVLGDELAGSATLIAHHWRNAGEPETAVRYLLSGAEHAAGAMADAEAARLYGEAAAIFEEANREIDAVEARLSRGRSLILSGDHFLAGEELGALLPRLRGAPRCRALLALARVAFWTADADGLIRFSIEAEAEAARLGDPALIARATTLRAEGLAMHGELDTSIPLLEDAARAWPKAARHDPDHCALWAQLAIDRYWQGDYERAEADARTGLALAEESQLLTAMLNVGAHLGMALTGMGRHEEAVAEFERLAALGSEWEATPRMTSRLINMWAGTERELGDVVRARELNERGLRLGEQAKFPGATVSARIDLLLLDLAAGEVGRSEARLPELRETTEGTKGWHQWLWQIRLAQAQADVLLSRGRAEEAAAAARDALERAGAIPRRKYMASALATLAEAALLAGRPDEALPHAEEASRIAAGLGHPPTRWRAESVLARARYAAGDDGGAEAAASSARELVVGFAERLSPERSERFLAAQGVAEILAAR